MANTVTIRSGFDLGGLRIGLSQGRKEVETWARVVRSATDLDAELKGIEKNFDRINNSVKAGLTSNREFRNRLQQQESALRGVIGEVDRWGDQYDQAAIQLARVRGELRTLNNDLAQQGQVIAGVGNRVTLGLTAPLLAAGGAAIKLASDAGEIDSKFDVVFAGLSNDAEAFADALGRNVGRAESDLKSYLATLQDTFVPLGFARDQAADLSKNLTALSIDVASFNNASDPDVIRDFQSALVGNTETVRKYGVVITAASTEQKVLELGLASTRSEITEQDKVYARYIQILEGTTDAQGDAARTADSATNTLKALQAAGKDAAVEFGENMLPIFTSVTRSATDLLRGFSELDEGTQDLVIRGALLAGALGPLITVIGNGVTVAANLRNAYLTLTAAQAASTVATGANATAFATLGARLLPLAGAAGLIIGVGVAAVALNRYLKGNQDIVKDSRSSFENLTTALSNYRSSLSITTETERQNAIESLNIQKTKIERLIQINQSFANSLVEQNDALLKTPLFLQLFRPGDIANLNQNSGLIQETLDQIGTLQNELKAIDTNIESVRTLDITVTPDEPFKPVTTGAKAAETELDKLIKKAEQLEQNYKDAFATIATQLELGLTSQKGALEQRISEVEQALGGFTSIYDSLSEEQKSLVDSLIADLGRYKNELASLTNTEAIALRFNEVGQQGSLINQSRDLALSRTSDPGTQSEIRQDAAEERLSLLEGLLEDLLELGASDAQTANVLDRIDSVKSEIASEGAVSVEIEPILAPIKNVTIGGAVFDESTGTYKVVLEPEVNTATPIDIPIPAITDVINPSLELLDRRLKNVLNTVGDISDAPFAAQLGAGVQSPFALGNNSQEAVNAASAINARSVNREFGDFTVTAFQGLVRETIVPGIQGFFGSLKDATEQAAEDAEPVSIPVPVGNATINPTTPGEVFEANVGLSKREFNSRLELQASLVKGTELEKERVENLRKSNLEIQRALNAPFANLAGGSLQDFADLDRNSLDLFAGSGVITGFPSALPEDGGDLVQEFKDGVNDAAATQAAAAQQFAQTIVSSAGEAGNLFIGIASGNVSAGQAIGGFGGIIGGALSAVPDPSGVTPLVGLGISLGSSLLGGIVDLFGNSEDDSETERRAAAQRSRTVPALNITAQVTQTNSFEGSILDPKTQAVLDQRTRVIVGEVLQQLNVNQLIQNSRAAV